MNFGVQTFTVRREQKKSAKAAYKKLTEMGVGSLEVARIKFTAKKARELAEISKELGMEISSIQVKPKYVLGNSDGIVEFCKITGCRRVIISMLPFGCILGGEDKFYKFIATLDSLAEIYAGAGITLAYHHHNWEYLRLSSGRSRMNELLSRTKRIKFVHDTYWTARCGISPARQIEEFGERLLGIHLRDLTFKKKGIEVLSRDCSVGDGVIDFGDVLRAAESVGCEYYVIEQNTKSPYEEIKKSLNKLEAIKRELGREE